MESRCFDNENGIELGPNMPKEEVFSMPKKDGANGILSCTMPLNYGGNLIDNFKLTFKEGKKVEFKAETGYENLKKLLETDEGAKYLGEIALVPVDSPISNTKTIFIIHYLTIMLRVTLHLEWHIEVI